MNTVPAMSEIGRKWLDDTRARFMDDPTADVVFAYSGPVDHGTVQHLLAEAEKASLAKEDGMAQRKRMMNVLVEGLENVQHHALASHREASFILLLRDQNGYRISFGNTVALAMAALLTHRVGILNEMDEADLKEHYLKLLSNSARSEHGGAGLGLLTMARRSMRPITVRSCKLCSAAAFLIMDLRVAA